MFFQKGTGSVVGRTVEISALRKDGTEFPVELSISAMNIHGRWHATGIIRDITERKRVENELIKSHSELSLHYDVSAAISRTIDMGELFDIVLNTITGLEILNVERKCGIFIIEGDDMKLVSHLGHTEEFLNLHKGMKVGDCLCGIAAKTGDIIVSKNSNEDIRHNIKYPEMVPHGHIVIPLRAIDRIVGVLYIYLPADVELSEDKMKMLRTIGDQIGIAINNSKLYEEKKALSLSDPLTNLANRRLMDILLERNFIRAKRFESIFSVIMLDIDHFKEYNDAYGHIAGDKLLVDIANILLEEVRGIDLVVRYGGEEFLILLPDTDLTNAREIAERMRKKVEGKAGITISLGVSLYQEGIENKEELIKKADEALYKTKNNGRNRVEVSG